MSCSEILGKHLSDLYAEHILHGKTKSSSVQNLKSAIMTAPHLAAEAQHKLDELQSLDKACGGQLSKRCYVSHVQKMGLEETLGG